MMLCVFGFICRFVCLSLFLIYPSFGTSGGLYFVIVAFPGYLQLCFQTISLIRLRANLKHIY